MSNKEKKLLNTIKNNAFKLKHDGQIPYSLYIAILNLNYCSSIEDIYYLMNLCEKYTRLKGYYIKYPDSAYECDKDLEKWKLNK